MTSVKTLYKLCIVITNIAILHFYNEYWSSIQKEVSFSIHTKVYNETWISRSGHNRIKSDKMWLSEYETILQFDAKLCNLTQAYLATNLAIFYLWHLYRVVVKTKCPPSSGSQSIRPKSISPHFFFSSFYYLGQERWPALDSIKNTNFVSSGTGCEKCVHSKVVWSQARSPRVILYSRHSAELPPTTHRHLHLSWDQFWDEYLSKTVIAMKLDCRFTV